MYSRTMKARDTNHRSIITNIFPFQAKAHGFPPCAFAVSGEDEKQRKKLDLFRRAWYYRNTCRGLFLCLAGVNPEKGGNLFEEVPQMRVKVTLACTECKQRNYDSKKNKKNDPDRLEMKKYCPFCKKHTLHRETR